MESMHPLIRVLCFLVFAAWMAWADGTRLLLGAALVFLLYLLVPAPNPRRAVAMMTRLRWFLLSLLIVYGWFTPGERPWVDASSSLAAFVPTIEGLEGGLLRCAALCMIVLAVNLLLQTTGRDQLLAAIHGLARPLAILGLPRERLALRMVLVMDAMGQVRQLVSESLGARRGGLLSLGAAGEFASDLMARVVDRAGNERPEPVTLTLPSAPSSLQWSYPVLLWVLFYAPGGLI